MSLRKSTLKADPKLILPQAGIQREAANARVLRVAKARQIAELALGESFAQLKANVGVEDAWHIFNDWIERTHPKSLLGHRGPSDYRHDRYLLGVYDRLAEQGTGKTGSLPRVIAEKLHNEKPGEYGNSVDAIAKKIRRLVKKDADHRAADAKVSAEIQGLLHELGWAAPGDSGNARRRTSSTKSRDK